MKKLVIFLVSTFFSVAVSAQNETEEANEQPDRDEVFRLHTLPYYNFGKGVGITSPDSIYQLNIRFRMQNRATYSDDGDEGNVDAQIRRLRLRLDGYVGNPKITYAIQLSFAPGDVGQIDEEENINIIRDAVVWYQPSRKWSIGFGQTKLPGNRQRFNSSGALQLTDRSINNARFNIDRDFGFQVHQLNMYKNAFSYNFKAAVSLGEGRNFTKNDDMGLAYTGKVELFPFGAFGNQGEYFEGDQVREKKLKLMLSGAYQFNDNAKRANGQLGDYLFEKRDLHSVMGDVILKYRGFAFMTTYMSRATKDPITYNPADSSQRVFSFVGNGMDFQASYLNKKNFEFIGRYSFQNVDRSIAALAPNASQYTIGITKYIWEHAFKIQSELTYDVRNPLNAAAMNSWYFRFQLEIGI